MRHPIELIKASSESDWTTASSFLTETVVRCEKNNVPLWTHEQVNVTSLKQSYSLNELYLLKYKGTFIGNVFVSFGSDTFWPDIDASDSAFFHKLAIGDQYYANNLGSLALGSILELAKQHNVRWLRCDCHGGRPRLRNFYERFGFQLVDRKERLGFDVARYQLPVNQIKAPIPTRENYV